MSKPNPTPSIRSTNSTTATEPLYQVKLLSALRSGDPASIHPFLAEIGKDRRKSVDGGTDLDTGAAALHLAVRCASVETVTLLLSHRAISPNGVHPPGSGTTALHLASSLGRTEIVNLLLEQPGIDDTLRDANGDGCRDVARNKDVKKAIDDSRSFLNASYQSLLRTYILSNAPPPQALLELLSSPRIRFVNLSYLDDSSGRALLHEATRRKDLRLIELVGRAGGDVFVRDRRGKGAGDGLGKDDRARVFLRQFANHDTTLIDATGPTEKEPPVLKGYLNKYTNVAKGYGTRWFVLKNGVLSYYRHQEDENIASRGAIAMKTATLKVSGGEKTRFEVQSPPSRGHTSSGIQKWYIKANHPVEASRWTTAISKSIEWYRREGAGVDDVSRRRISVESQSSLVKNYSQPSHLSSVSTLIRKKTIDITKLGGGSTSSFVDSGLEEGNISPVLHDAPPPDHRNHDEDEERADDSSTSESTSQQQLPPHDANFDLQGNATTAQVELISQLLSNFTLPPNAPVKTQELRNAVKDSFGIIQSMINEFVQMAKERDEWWKTKLRHEQERQAVWEESLQTVVKEGEALERELRTRSRKRGSRFFDASTSEAGGTLKRSPGTLKLAKAGYFPEASIIVPSPTGTVHPATQVVDVDATMAARPSTLTPTLQRRHPSMPSPHIKDQIDDPNGFDTDEEDEFYDAIEADNLPNLEVPEMLTSPTRQEPQLPDTAIEQYIGYRKLRDRLPISEDNRPSTSLWSVLKHSIGKDLTKISFPVFFNEPTSMLQRMAEDMEFSECLDVAAQEADAHRRIAFVAAFAMSNYSSTIGRIAKPFNPMLNETFEYVRLDKKYRYISEQVSHHPPISACWAESPQWNYYGEVDAQNKFMGKSFEIRPTGVAHVDLIIPEELGSNYPKATGKFSEGRVVEHYSWKKVTTNVSGFILGSPTIDHYGDMTITNHRTKDQCILTFKPRGWRGKDAFEISGYVQDANGDVTYEIAGRWNKQLIAKAVGSGGGFLHPDAPVSGSNTPDYVLLWRNSEKPSAPFNLTPFALTLNHCPKDTLQPYLCPTDCRLRPDQRAFEMGQYERANELKNAQEEKQRATRKAREEGSLGPHKPRWFSASTDGDTGERIWAPAVVDGHLEYWVERERAWKAGGGAWAGVDPIFVEDQ